MIITRTATGAKNVPWDVCRCSLRPWRRPHCRSSGPCHCLKLWDVLLTHTGNVQQHLGPEKEKPQKNNHSLQRTTLLNHVCIMYMYVSCIYIPMMYVYIYMLEGKCILGVRICICILITTARLSLTLLDVSQGAIM